MELIHKFVETIDSFFGNVCELDLIFNFEKTIYILDEIILGGYLSETNLRTVLHDARLSFNVDKNQEK